MPTYAFKNRETGEEIEAFLSLSERETFLQENLEWFQIITTAPALGDSVRLGITKTPDSFNSLLKNISKRNDNRKNKSQINHR